MKKLEKKILKKVYAFETKKTITELLIEIGSICIVIIAGVFIVSSLIKQLIEQQSLDMFQIFQEDKEIIKQYLGDVLNTFYQELPKNEAMWSIILTILFIFLVLIFIHNFEKISNRIKALKKFWSNRV